MVKEVNCGSQGEYRIGKRWRHLGESRVNTDRLYQVMWGGRGRRSRGEDNSRVVAWVKRLS